jgi:iron complex transport system substrate-binding protein
MKKVLIMLVFVITLAISLAIGTTGTAEEFPIFAVVVDADGNEVTVRTNPKTIAVYDYAILDMLDAVGVEALGIEKLIVPTKDTLPAALSYYSKQGNDKVISGGSLFYVDWDVLDLVQPELMILGGRSFGMNASGERLSGDDAVQFRTKTLERYAKTVFVKLAINAAHSRFTQGIERNVTALAAIFPDAASAFENKLAEVKSRIKDVHDKAAAAGKTALFCMMVDQTTLSVFNPNSRFDMLFEDFGFTPVDAAPVSWTDQHGFNARAEYVLEKNPDVIFLLDRSSIVGSGAGADNFKNDPVIAKTKAAANGDIYVLSGDAWYTMTGGFSATETMIADLSKYLNRLD